MLAVALEREVQAANFEHRPALAAGQDDGILPDPLQPDVDRLRRIQSSHRVVSFQWGRGARSIQWPSTLRETATSGSIGRQMLRRGIVR